MQVQRLRTTGQLFGDHFNGVDQEYKYRDDYYDDSSTIPVSYSLNSSPLASSAGVNHIEHKVSKMDTLAGVAIKYGVEVADIKRTNGLVSDVQMFAYKTLQIPLPGRHPPSPCLSNGAEEEGDYTPTRRPGSDVMNLFDTVNSKNPSQNVSPAMNNFSLRSTKSVSIAEGTEMAVYSSTKGLQITNSVPNRHRKSRSLAKGLSEENDEVADKKATSESTDNSDNERSMKRCQKADAKRTLCTPELLLKDDTSNDFSNRMTKGLALRTKSTNRTDMEVPGPNAILYGDSLANNAPLSLPKSISTPSFQDSEKSSSLWSTGKWTLKTDVISRPIIEGLPKPINVRRIKAAMD